MTEDTQTVTKKQSVLWTLPPSWLGVRGGISDTSDGILAWGRAGESNVRKARLAWAKKAGLRPQACVTLDQVHGNRVHRVLTSDAGSGFLNPEERIASCDGQITNLEGIVLITSHADCAPLYLYHKKSRTIGLVHAGWRGTLAGIAALAVAKMSKEFLVAPSDVEVAVGPMITTRSYVVGNDVATDFQRKFGGSVVTNFGGRPHLDIFACLIIDLLRAGVTSARHSLRPPDTYSDNCWSSFRRDGDKAGGMLAFISIT